MRRHMVRRRCGLVQVAALVGVQPLESRVLLSTVAISGTAGADTIAATWLAGQLAVVVNGVTTNYSGATGLTISGLAGNDSVQVNVPFGVTVDAGAGDDTIVARDGQADTLDGGLGNDTVTTDSADRELNFERVNPYTPAADNRPMDVKVLVMNYSPHVPSQGNQLMWQAFGWTDPRTLAADYEATIERTSGGLVNMEIVDWMDFDTLVPRADGYVYGADEYYNIWSTTRTFHSPDTADNAKLMIDNGVPQRVAMGEIDEVWVFAPPSAGADWEASMLGPRSFFINGGVYGDVPSERPFALYGFNYERGVDCMTENTLHRIENHMSRAYGGWNLGSPSTNWDRFTANITQSPITPGVGSCHYAPNSLSDYDWANPTYVTSNAEDWLNYPNLTGATQAINCTAWTNGGTRDTFIGHHNWWLEHLPRAPGVNADGRENNWWKYAYDYDNYMPDTGAPKPFRAAAVASDLTALSGGTYRFRVSYSDPMAIAFDSLDNADVRVTGPHGFAQLAHVVGTSRTKDSTFIVVTYEITAPGGAWDGGDTGYYRISTVAGQVMDVAGNSLAAGSLGMFYAGAAPLDTLSENSARLWTAWADGATASVTDDATEHLIGNASLKFVTDGGFDTMLRYAPGSLWDMTQAQVLTMSLKAQNPSPWGFQNASPWIRLVSQNGGYVQFQYYQGGCAYDVLSDCRGVWKSFVIPLDAPTDQVDGWRGEVVGNPDLTRITGLEIHADTWDSGFTMWVDGVSLDVTSVKSVTGTNGPDQIGVAVDSGDSSRYAITVNGVATYVQQADITGISISALGGDDTVTIGAGVMGVTIDGGTGNDSITGGGGDDSIRGDAGNDTIVGGGGDDTLMGNTEDDSIIGGAGADSIMAGLGADTLDGGIGNDILLAGDGRDSVLGGDGDDWIEGRGKMDTIYGGVGNDTIWGGAGSDLIYGEDGDDWIDVGVSTVFHDSVDGGAGYDLVCSDSDDVLSGCEGVWPV